jgi:threonine/homoserine/homoserine lactone efflux protein
MPFELYAAFVGATVILILIPGPNVALIVANSIALGPRYGLMTVAGTSAAMVLQLGVTVLGLGGLLALMAGWFEWVRWLGVAYLAYLGIQAWRAPAADFGATKAQPGSLRDMFLRGFIVSLTNPKTLLFYSAFLPQFVDGGADRTVQLVLLAVTFLAIAVALDSGWALLASRLRAVLGLGGRLLNRITGGLLLTGAIGLALARKP